MRPSLKAQRLIALASAGAVMLNFPLLALYTGWAVLIGCAAWIVHVKRKSDAETDGDSGDG